MKTKKERKQAISLIVLIITIIVMIILAGTVVISLNNSGIIDKAQEAVKKTNEAQVKQIAQLGWAEAYAAGARTVEALQAGVEDILEKNKIDATEYGINVTTSGVEVAKGWLQVGLTVVKGNLAQDETKRQVLTIGDSIEYDETAGDTVEVGKDVEWQILGASDEGELLIMSAEDIVSSHTLGDDEDIEESKNDWLNGATELDELCVPYGKGKSAIRARSIRREDLDKIISPDKTTYAKGKLNEYGNIVTFSYNGTNYPSYTSTNGISGTLSDEHSDGFYYYNGTEFVCINDLTTGIVGTIFATVKSDYYIYYSSEIETAVKESKAYKMIFGADSNLSYWLANPYVEITTRYHDGVGCGIEYGICGVFWGSIYNGSVLHSDGFIDYNDECGVRAVVSLASDVHLSGSSDAGWSY